MTKAVSQSRPVKTPSMPAPQRSQSRARWSDLTLDVFTNAPAEFPNVQRHPTRQRHVEHPCNVLGHERRRLAVAACCRKCVSHDSNKFVHPSPWSFWISFSHARFDCTLSHVASRARSGKVELIFDGVVALSNVGLVTFAVHDPSERVADDAEVQTTPLRGQSQPSQAKHESSPSGRACRRPRISPPLRGQSTRIGP